MARRRPSSTTSLPGITLPEPTGLATAPRVTPESTSALPKKGDGGGVLASVISRTHTLYTDWLSTWQRLGYLYEGDGPYLNGEALEPHPRERTYALKGDGTTDFSQPTGFQRKYLARQALARFEDFPATIINLFADYQYQKHPERHVGRKEGLSDRAELEEWWEDVDGFGTSITAWLKRYQVLTNTFGHTFVVMDRETPNTRRSNITPRGGKTLPVTLADLGRPILRLYTPPQAPDWLAPQGQLSAIKFQESVERANLLQTVLPTEKNYFLWDQNQWVCYNSRGSQLRASQHGMGVLPVRVWYARRRARLAIIGRSLLGTGQLYHDHYNMTSELRELLRSNVFSMLNIQLGENETVEQARLNMGQHAGTDAILFTKGSAQWIAPPDGPASIYMENISAAERKMFRLATMPWESDSTAPESGDSRRIKASDLNSSLAAMADEAEMLDLWIARMFYRARYGKQGEARFKEAEIRISHPDEFHVEQLAAAAEDAKLVLELGVGPTATKLIKANLIPLAVRDLPPNVKQDIDQELEAAAKEEDQQKKEMAKVELETGRATIENTKATTHSTLNPPVKPGAAGDQGASGAKKARKRKVSYDPETGTATIEDN